MDYQYLQFNNIWGLYSLISDLKHPYPDFLQQQYSKFHQHYFETLTLLEELGFIYEDKKLIKILSKFTSQNSRGKISSEMDFRNTLINTCLKSDKYSDEINELLNKCYAVNDKLVFELNFSEKMQYSDVRNFYISLGLIDYSPDSQNYFINPKYNKVVSKNMKSSLRKMSLNTLEKILENKKQIGYQAELAVMDFEINKLKNHPNFTSDIIQQISEIDVNAGYDILSFLPDEDFLLPIKIEVKAVSPVDYKFYLSEGELSAAKEEPHNYYLYLLPVIGENQFDFNKMFIIRDPYNNVVLSEAWNEHIQSRLFSLNNWSHMEIST